MTNGNEPAFSISDERQGAYYEGLTKREYFAAMAMQGLVGNPAYDLFNPDDYAIHAVRRADSLIEALNRPMCPDCKTRFADDGHYDTEHKICPDYERAISER